MEEETTTDAPVETGGQTIHGVAVDDQGQAIPEPETTESAPAVETTDQPEEKTEQPTEPSNEDEQLAKFAETKGLTLDSENATKAAKMAMNAEKLMHKKTARASELEKSLSTASDEIAEDVAISTGQDPELLKRLQRVEVKDVVRTFWDENPEAKIHEKAMIEELQRKPHLAGDLESLYANVLVKSGNNDAIKSQGKREALESLAAKQTAAVPRGNAVNGESMGSATITPQNVDQLVGQNSLEWFEKHRSEINAAMAG